MKQDWEVKSVSKSGSDFQIMIGPTTHDGGEPGVCLIAALVVAAIIMGVSSLSGWAWFWGLFFVWFAVFLLLPPLARLFLTFIMISLVMLIVLALIAGVLF